MLGASYSFEKCDDTALVKEIKSNGSGADQAFELMCARYLNLISSIASNYLYCAQDYELSDFMQEGLIGLFSACNTFDENSGKSFKNYAMLCVENRFRSIYRQQNKKGFVPFSSTVSIDDSVDTLEDSNALSMQESLESKEYIKSIYAKIEDTLSQLEKRVLSLYLSGYSYKQSATALNVSEKAVDNALYRIRKKLSR